jgi:hypothetical protein
VDANITVGNFTEFRLISTAKPSSLADVLNVPWTSSRSTDGQMEDRAFRKYVRGRQAVVKMIWVPNSETRREVEKSQTHRVTQNLVL